MPTPDLDSISSYPWLFVFFLLRVCASAGWLQVLPHATLEAIATFSTPQQSGHSELEITLQFIELDVALLVVVVFLL